MVDDVVASQQTVVQRITESQKEVVTELTDAADVVERSGKNTRDAASNLERVAVGLEQLTRADFQAMTDGVKQANQDLVAEVRKTSSEFQQMIQGLAGLEAHLQQTTQALTVASQALVPASRPRLSRLYIALLSGAALGALALIGELAVVIMRIH